MIESSYSIKTNIYSSLISKIDRNFLFKKITPLVTGIIILITSVSVFVYKYLVKSEYKDSLLGIFVSRASMSKADFKNLMSFVKEEGLFLRDLKGIDDFVHRLNRVHCNTLSACIIYAKYLIKTSEDHPLKDIPAQDILFINRYWHGDMEDLMEIAKTSGYSAPKLSGKIIDKYIIRPIKDEGESEDECIVNDIYFVDKKLVMDHLKKLATKEFGTDVYVLQIQYAKARGLIEDLKENYRDVKVKFTNIINNKKFMALPSKIVSKSSGIVEDSKHILEKHGF